MGSGGSQTSGLFGLHTESKYIQHHEARRECHSSAGQHLGYCSQRLLSTLLPWKGCPAPAKAWRSCYLIPKNVKSLTEVPLEAQKRTQGPIVLNVGFPQPKSMGSLCQKCSRLGSDSPKDAYAKRKSFPQFCDRYIASFKTASRLH